jgi:hypothetical protein
MRLKGKFMLKKIFCESSILCFAACLVLCVFSTNCSDYTTQKNNLSDKLERGNQNNMKNEEIVYACNPYALDKEQRARYGNLTKQLIAGKQAVNELSDGYEIRYPANPQNIKDVAEFITYERLCCPFLNFEMAVEAENLFLRLKGGEGVKEFIKMEFGI